MNLLPGWFPDSGAGVLPLDLAFQVAAMNEADQSSYDFGTLAFGAEYAGRYILVAVATGSATATGVSIGGGAATQIVANNGGASSAEYSLWYRLLPTGTTGNVTVTMSGAAARASVGVYSARLVGVAAIDTLAVDSADPMSGNIDLVDGGGLIGIYQSHSGGGQIDWTGLTQDHDAPVSSSRNFSVASITNLPAEVNRAISGNPTANSDVSIFVVSLR